MGITEVVRGADLLLSTARQILLYRALGLTPPAFYHCALMLDEKGKRLAKRHDALSLRALRERGKRRKNCAGFDNFGAVRLFLETVNRADNQVAGTNLG